MNKKYYFPWKLVIVLIVTTFISCSVFAYISTLEYEKHTKLVALIFGITWILGCLSFIIMKLVIERENRKSNYEVKRTQE